MALNLGDNISYLGAKPLDTRLKYDTLSAMASVNDSTMYDGCIAYCVESKTTYQWKSTNIVDEDIGRWREFEGANEENSIIEEEITLEDYNKLSNAEKMNGTNYFITDGQASSSMFSIQKATLAAGHTSVQFSVPTTGSPLLTLYTSDPNVSYLSATISSGVATYTFGAQSNAIDVYLKIEVF